MTVVRPRLRGVSHQIAFYVAVGAGVALIAATGTARSAAATTVYGGAGRARELIRSVRRPDCASAIEAVGSESVQTVLHRYTRSWRVLKKPLQYVVGARPHQMALAAAEDPASPNSIALGEPPPKQPPEPGITALGTSLLSTAF